MQKTENLLEYYKNYTKTEAYKTIQKYFKKNDCTNFEIIGPVADLCRNSETKKIEDWCNYYLNSTYAQNLNTAVSKLQNCLQQNNLTYDNSVVLECIETFILYQTWIGVQQEKKLMRELYDDNFYCLYPTANLDIAHNIDIILVSKKIKKWVCGIQVKPHTYTEIEVDRNRTETFLNRYHVPAFTVRYNSEDKSFFSSDLKNLSSFKYLLLKYEKASK